MNSPSIVGKAKLGQTVLGDTTDENPICPPTRPSIDLFVPNTPAEYPKDLHPFPENYTIYLPSDKYNPVEKVAAGHMRTKN